MGEPHPHNSDGGRVTRTQLKRWWPVSLVFGAAAFGLAALIANGSPSTDSPDGPGGQVAAVDTVPRAQPTYEGSAELLADLDSEAARRVLAVGREATEDDRASGQNTDTTLPPETAPESTESTEQTEPEDAVEIGDGATTTVAVVRAQPAGRAPADQPEPTSQAPATRPSSSRPPATRPPTTRPPGTEPPATRPPTTQPSTTRPPTTRPPTTRPPTTTVPPPTTAGTTCATGAEFERILRDDFSSSIGDHWIQFNNRPGHAGNGRRMASANSIQDGHLVITARTVDGKVNSGGLAHKVDLTYGKFVARVRTDRDPTLTMSGVVLTWPQSDDNGRDGENNFYETLVKTPERNPFFSFIHKPFGVPSQQQHYRHDADGSQFQLMTLEWTPDRIAITRQGPGGGGYDRWVIDETSANIIPDAPHHLAIQLDARTDTLLPSPVRMEVDFVEVHRYCG